jgi:hypothetical protein
MAPPDVRRWLPPLLGLLLALPFIPFFRLHPDGAYDLLTLLLVLGAGVRLGAAPASGAARAGAVLLAIVLVVLALLAFFWSPLWLAAGFMLLAGWTFAAHRRRPHPPLLPFGSAWSLAAAGVVLWMG